MQSSSGILSIDALFSFIPLVLMLSFSLNLAYSLSSLGAENFHRQQVFDKLVSISDYSVKVGLSDGSPNYIGINKITPIYVQRLGNISHLSRLSISDQKNEDSLFCISRLVLERSTNNVVKIYFCGD